MVMRLPLSSSNINASACKICSRRLECCVACVILILVFWLSCRLGHLLIRMASGVVVVPVWFGISDQGADAGVGENLQQGGMWHASVDDMGALYASFYRIQGATDFRQHAAVNGAIRD